MKTEKNILVAFLLNFLFSVFEFVGGLFINSVAILSDSKQDMGDKASIGVTYFLERISKKKPDEKYTYGYVRYSVLGSIITTIILIAGSAVVIYNSVLRIINPVEINYDGMIIFAVFGFSVNLLAAYFTKEGDSLNQKSINLHMLEDVLGWLVVLIGAIVMHFTNISIIDPILSIGVALFILISALKNFVKIMNIFLEKTPSNINLEEIKEHLLKIKGVKDVHHIHVRSIDGYNNYATMHVVATGDHTKVKQEIKDELKEHSISHTTIEIEATTEKCDEENCEIRESEAMHMHEHNH